MSTNVNAEWNNKKNNRRCDLIDKEVDGTISPIEQIELENLQKQLWDWKKDKTPYGRWPNHKK